ncbi:hypothetical protein GLU01_01075 [Nanohaloarchaea archaeon]|jgi:vacuolar-type H+-ATPase subunit F/Vma7|nr:hypothetical protein [Candidatus Nanohaloarchaea archaeon]
MRSIATLGTKDFNLGFKLAGVDKTYTDTSEFEQILDEGRHGILVVQGDTYQELPGRLRERADSSAEPVVVPLSEEAESERLDRKIKQAIGTDITE